MIISWPAATLTLESKGDFLKPEINVRPILFWKRGFGYIFLPLIHQVILKSRQKPDEEEIHELRLDTPCQDMKNLKNKMKSNQL